MKTQQKTTFDFTSFYKKFHILYPKSKKPDKSFLEWFIGFSEAEGTFTLAKRGDMAFVVVQSTSDVEVLNYIKKSLSFGKVIVQSEKQKTHRYVVQDTHNIGLICELFNGNMVFPTRKARFVSFLSFYNEKLIKKNMESITIKNDLIIPSLNDSWLSGITDGEGCFTTSILSNSLAYRIRYILTQKWDVNKLVLSHTLDLFCIQKRVGAIVPHSVSNVWELRIDGVKNCEYILSYFDKYKLKTKKEISYIKWKQLLNNLKNNQHLDNDKRLVLKELSKDINKSIK